MGPRKIRLGTPEASQALAAWERSRLDPPDEPDEDCEDDEPDYEPPEEREMTDADYDRVEDNYFRGYGR